MRAARRIHDAKSTLRSGIALTLFVGGSVSIAPAVAAQDTQQADQGGDRVILVTARKRTENITDVPIAITAFGEQQIEQADLENIQNLAQLTPNFTFPDNGQRYIDAPVIRGLIGNDGDPTKQSASFYLDGVFVSGSISGINFDDVARAEVLKGPQSAQFGRSTFAGAINFVTKRPGDTLEGNINGKLAEFGEYEISAGLMGPLIEDLLSFRISGRYYEFGGEFENNAGTPAGIDLGGQSTTNFSGSLFFTPTSDFELRATIRYAEDDDDAAPSQFVNDVNCTFATPTVCGAIEIDEDQIGQNLDSFIAAGIEPGLQREQLDLVLAAEYDFGGAVLSATAAYHDEDLARAWDVEGSPAVLPFFVGVLGAEPGLDAAQIVNDWKFKDFQLEARLSSAGDGPFTWSVGGYYADIEQRLGRSFGAVALDPPNTRLVENVAVFAQLGYTFADIVTVGIEGRYQEEKLSRVSPTTGEPLILGGGVPAEATFEAFLPRFTASIEATPDLTFYLQVAKGNKPGDFNTATTTPVDEVVLDEETLWNYEAGLKGNLLDGRLAFGAAIFHMDLSNLQVRDVTPGTFQILTRNAGAAKSTGFEFDATARITEFWTLRGAVGYADFRFTDFENDAAAEQIFGDGNVNGNLPRSVPNWTGTASSNITLPVSDIWDVFVFADANYRSRIFASPANVAFSDARIQANLRVGLANDRLRLEGFVRNLFDDDTPDRVGTTIDFLGGGNRVVIAVPTRGRQFGVRASLDF